MIYYNTYTLKKMSSVHETCFSSYPYILFFVLITLCYKYHISYVYAGGYLINFMANYCLKLFFIQMIGSAGNRPIPYHPANPLNVLTSAVGKADAYGFPSGHAQSVGYFLAFINQFLPWKAWHPGWLVATFIVAIWLLYTRVVFRRHTPIQVLFGFMFGVAVFQAFHWTIINLKY